MAESMSLEVICEAGHWTVVAPEAIPVLCPTPVFANGRAAILPGNPFDHIDVRPCHAEIIKVVLDLDDYAVLITTPPPLTGGQIPAHYYIPSPRIASGDPENCEICGRPAADPVHTTTPSPRTMI